MSAKVYWPGDGSIPVEAVESPLGSMVVRGKIIEVALNAILDMKSMLLGSGWGHTSELLLKEMHVFQYDQLNLGYNLHFHTHNEVFEHLISLGIPGLILFLSYAYFIFRDSFKFSVLLAIAWFLFFGVTCFWFVWSGTLPLLAAAVACTTRIKYRFKINITNNIITRNQILIKMFAFSIMLSILCYGASMAYLSINQFNKRLTYDSFLNEYPENDVKCDYYKDYGKGGKDLSHILITYVNRLTKRAYHPNVPGTREEKEKEASYKQDDLKVLKRINCVIDKMIVDGGASLELINASVVAPAVLIFNNYKKLDLETKDYLNWENRVLELLKLAPKRGDILVPFISESLSRREFKKIYKICNLLDKNEINLYCELAKISIMLDNPNLSSNEFKKAIIKLDGLLDLKVYGWWQEEDFYSKNIDGIGPSGIPLSGDMIFLIKDKEARKIHELLEELK